MSDVFPGLLWPVHTADIVVGLGARAQATTDDVLALIDAVLAEHDLHRNQIAACITLRRKCTHPALIEAAKRLGVPLLGVEEDELAHAVPTPSAIVLKHIALPSVAEAAALTAGPLIAEKRSSANVTCALSRQLPMAASAASTLSTSRAGP
ncbi:cobalamin biosynthesis protein [Devosia rhizoryzae]|uniref:Cobalamin biosynthesis protein n=1 Tax=Devosia rhizoryzae TaxID=2774137 RepID=A0ABX7C1U8_9HYPH|nr:cobalamin biosynthesis protein [Devosia rhizoryzae]QQR38210.1 cobalamin biosynthesis protein [Devosia rhizoryzae]